MRRWVRLAAAAALVAAVVLVGPGPAAAGVFDCKESPTPDSPGQGLAGFFTPTPDPLPPEGDPFAEDATTTMYQQYGFAGLRWSTYDLGCGPDAARNPDAVVGTAISNWLMNVPVSLAAVTASLTEAAFNPGFLGVFDPALDGVSTALHQGLFAHWAPVVIAGVGILLLVKARRLALATTAGAVGWAILVVLVATALFRWPVQAGTLADATVTGSLGAVVDGLDGTGSGSPGASVAAGLQSSILYTSWLAGTLGSTSTETAEEYGPKLFQATTLTWAEARLVQTRPEQGRELIEEKQEAFADLAEQIQEDDPTAYEHLTGRRSDTRVGYALLATLATLLALPFLLLSALLLLGSFLVIRLAVMLFPLIATLGLFPTARGIVIGVAKTVGAALVNAVVFGAGAAVTVLVFGIILDPGTGLPGWLVLVLLPVFSMVMWVLLKPFRRLTSMGRPSDSFADAASLGHAGSKTAQATRSGVMAAGTAAVGGVATAATAAYAAARKGKPGTKTDPTEAGQPVERAEARPMVDPTPALPAPPAAAPAAAAAAGPAPPPPGRGRDWRRYRHPPSTPTADPAAGTVREETAEARPMVVVVAERIDGEEVYPIYRPPARTDTGDHDPAGRPG